MTRHLTREQLLNYLDGELSRTKMRAAGAHIQSCWACRTELEHLQHDIGLIHDAQKSILLPGVPPPPQPWPRLESRLASVERSGLFHLLRIGAFLNLASRPVPVLTVMVGLVAVVALLWLNAPSVSAKEILRRASEADGTRLTPPPNRFTRQKVRVTSVRRGSNSREIGHIDSWRSGKGVYWHIAQSDAAALDLQRHYRAENVSDLPLSAASYQTWSKETSTDGQVKRVAGLLNAEFRTASPAGPDGLQLVNLRVRPEDWHVTGMDLDFADAQFELAEEELAILPRGEVPPDVLSELDPATHTPESRAVVARNVEPTSTMPVFVPSPDLDDVEMDVRYTLHQIGADLGDPVEVVQDPSSRQIVVRAWAMPPARQDVLMQLLQNKPAVQLQLQLRARKTEASAESPVILTPAAPVGASPEREADKQRLQKWFGTSQAQEDFTRSILASSTELLARLYAMKQLADRWPPESVSGLSTQSRAELAAMVQDNSRAAEQRCAELRLMVKPLLNDFSGATDENPLSAAGHSWQESAVSALRAAKEVDSSLRSVLTTNAGDTFLNDVLAQVRRGLADVGWEVASMTPSKL